MHISLVQCWPNEACYLGYQLNMHAAMAHGCYAILSGERLHDFFIGVTFVDFTTKPQPGNYSLCRTQYMAAATDGQILDLHCDPGVEGRYVCIQVLGSNQPLTLCEVQVFEAGQIHKCC